MFMRLSNSAKKPALFDIELFGQLSYGYGAWSKSHRGVLPGLDSVWFLWLVVQ